MTQGESGVNVAAPEQNRVLNALAQAAVDVTNASAGWIVVSDGGDVRVVAAAGGDVSGLIGQSVPATSGTAGYVLAAGQPLALSGRSGQECPGDGVPALIGIQPTSVLCVPCLDQDVTTGALELVNKAGGAAFTFDDVEIATVLAEVTGVALSDTSTAAPAVPNPQELSGELERLALTQPGQYAAVAAAVSALIARE